MKCSKCGYGSQLELSKCPSCNSWGTFVKNKTISKEALYKQACKEVDQEQTNCVFCNRAGGSDHHHLLGKVGKLYYDKRYIFRAHRQCHREWHDHHSGKLPYWYNDFIIRMKKVTAKRLKS